MTQTGGLPRRLLILIALTCAALLLAACSADDTLEPEPTATPTAVSFEPGDVAVGTLLERSRASWDSVDAWVAETRSDTATSDGDGVSGTTTDTVILPDSRHILTMNGETVVAEEIALDGTIYMRGTLVASSIYPDVDADTWIRFTPDQVPEGTALAQEVAFLTAPPEFPFATMSEETRALPASPAGEVRVGDRTCDAWRFTTTTPDAPGIEYTIAFDAEDRPCQLVRAAGGVVETTTWDYPAEPAPITAPKDAVPVDAFPTAP